ncbi:lytic transglycosylase [Candidatus Woesearchaeota archaeon]|nr:lytic transglycosylase [Candidatus Woesearchaeota archaeon]
MTKRNSGQKESTFGQLTEVATSAALSLLAILNLQLYGPIIKDVTISQLNKRPIQTAQVTVPFIHPEQYTLEKLEEFSVDVSRELVNLLDVNYSSLPVDLQKKLYGNNKKALTKAKKQRFGDRKELEILEAKLAGLEPVIQRAEESSENLDVYQIGSLIGQESGADALAISISNARGYTQPLPTTWTKDLGREPWQIHTPENIIGGAEYLDWLISVFKGDVLLAKAAYNCGIGTMLNLIGREKTTDWQKLKRFTPKETQQYVARTEALDEILFNYDSYGLPKLTPIDPPQFIAHEVEKGESLSVIGGLYGVDWKKIAHYNLITLQEDKNPVLDIGQTVFVPYDGEA